MGSKELTTQEIYQLGLDIYDREIRPHVEPHHSGDFLVLDIDTGNYELDSDEVAASRRAESKCPSARLVAFRVGFPAAYNLGSRHASTAD